MNKKSGTKKRSSSAWVNLLIYLGLMVVVFSFGRGLVDLLAGPASIDLESDDELEAGFLPVYAEQGERADPQAVEVDTAGLPVNTPTVTPQPFAMPTQAPEVPPTPTATPDPGLPPDRLVIPAINLDAPVEPVSAVALQHEGEIYQQWQAPPGRAAGWHNTSVGLGAPGNTVLNGHHNIRGEVFRDLYQLTVGENIQLYSGDQLFTYVVVYIDILPERNQPLEVRLANSEWIQPTLDERVTLITCWPYESNTHRVVVVAVPINTAQQPGAPQTLLSP